MLIEGAYDADYPAWMHTRPGGRSTVIAFLR